MPLRDEIASLQRQLEKADNELDKLREENRELQDEVRHYRQAVAAVKWLWERAAEQPPFQL